MSESGEATEKTLDPAVQNGVAEISLDGVPGSPSSNKSVSSTAPSAESSPVASTLDSSSSEKPATFKENFRAFSKFGDTKSDGKTITLSQSDKWMKQAKVIDGKKITTTDTGIYFKKFKLQKLHLEEYEKYLADLGKNKKVELADMKKKMTECGPPGVSSSASATKNASTVDRLTDPTKYTGASKLRFDESGKGKGIAGRKDLPDKSGYVHGYKDKDSYNKTH